MIKNISVVIIANNAEKTLPNTLNSLKEFSEVIVYENNSTDNTKQIAKSFTNVTLIEGDFLGFGKTKNKAISYATNEWILSLDSDEVLSDEFIKNLKSITLNHNCIYEIHRINFYKNNQIKYCWKDDFIIRLFNKTKTSFTNKDVHEKIIKNNFDIVRLQGYVLHYPYSSIEQFINKANTYSTLFAKNNVGKKSSSPTKAFFNATYSFFRTYIIKQGFRDGYVGLLIAVSHAMTNFYKYLKLYELNKELKTS